LSRDRATRARHLAREQLVKALYQWQIAGHTVHELKTQFSTAQDFERCDREYFEELLATVVADVAALDAFISRYAVRSIEQLDAVGRAVLLIGLAELKHRPHVPTKVIINEGIELTKRYGVTDSHKFVNAVLDKASRELRPRPAAEEAKA
jgi:transcription antitermination protein NusB